MKREVLSCWLLIAPLWAWAQTEQGVGWWSGSVGVGKSHTNQFQEVGQSNTLTINFTQGTFVKTDLLLGADLRLSRTRNLTRQGFNFDAVTDDRQTSFAAAPFIRRFWGKQALRGYAGGGLLVEYSRDRLLTANTKTLEAEDLTNRWRVRPELQAGLFYAISPRWGTELSARSSVAPIAFTDLSLGLVILTGVEGGQKPVATNQVPTQLLAGNWLVSGSFDVGTDQQRLTSAAGERATTVETRQMKQYAFKPSIGLFTGRRWVVGVGIPVSRKVQSNEFARSAQSVSGVASDVTTEALGVSPFAKKYLTKARFGPFVGAQVGWQRERTYGNGAAATLYATTYTWHLGGGLAYLLGKGFIVEGELAGIGNQWSANQTNGESGNQLVITATLRPTITMSYIFL